MFIVIMLLSGVLSSFNTNNITKVVDLGYYRGVIDRNGDTTLIQDELEYLALYDNLMIVEELPSGDQVIINKDLIRKVLPYNSGSAIQFCCRLNMLDVRESIYDILGPNNLIGEIRIWTSDSIPDKWIKCDGRSLRTGDYPTLYQKIGNKFGGDSLYFNIPNLTGRSPIGSGNFVDTSINKIYSISDTGGVSMVKLTEDQIPSHGHNINVMSTRGQISSPSNKFISDADPFDGDFGLGPSDTTLNAKSISKSGGDEYHENRPPYLVLDFIIKAKSMGTSENMRLYFHNILYGDITKSMY